MDRLLVAIDDSQKSYQAVEYALSEFPEANIEVIHVPEIPLFASDPDKQASVVAEEYAQDILSEAKSLAAKYDQSIETEIRFGHPATEVISYADERDIDHIIVGSQGKQGAKRLLLGSVAESIVRQAHCPVTVVR